MKYDKNTNSGKINEDKLTSVRVVVDDGFANFYFSSYTDSADDICYPTAKYDFATKEWHCELEYAYDRIIWDVSDKLKKEMNRFVCNGVVPITKTFDMEDSMILPF